MTPSAFEVGDRVEKRRGYKYPGVVVAVFTKLDGQTRYVVESTVFETRGMLHIFSFDQLILHLTF